jgi:hypothetical protein
VRSWKERNFDQQFARLPVEVRAQAISAYRQFRTDPFHASLQFKAVTGVGSIWSVRIGRHYRALGRREADTVAWFWIGTHAEYDQLLRRR